MAENMSKYKTPPDSGTWKTIDIMHRQRAGKWPRPLSIFYEFWVLCCIVGAILAAFGV